MTYYVVFCIESRIIAFSAKKVPFYGKDLQEILIFCTHEGTAGRLL